MAATPDRRLGRHYTPAALTRPMVQAGLDALAKSDSANVCRVLDPACGDGAFLLEVFEQLCGRLAGSGRGGDIESTEMTGGLTPAARLGVVRDSIFGVDIDPVAVDALRRELFARIGACGALADTARDVVVANIRLGDALTGPGPVRARLSTDTTPGGGFPAASESAEPPAIDWEREFPAAAAGFDMIVGNPPYVRERDARELFSRIASSELGRRWREARMDLWYYFAHRSLDLLRPGGVLSFVVNSYWTASRGARRLIERFERETHVEEIELLGNRPLFAGVSGRHLVFRARKVEQVADRPASSDGDPGRQRSEQSGADAARDFSRIIVHPDLPRKTRRKTGATPDVPSGACVHEVPHRELFDKGRILLVPPDRLSAVRNSTRPLGATFDTRQGMAENPPVITRRLARRFASAGVFSIGEGVFVLRPFEIERLCLTEEERGLLRPYFETEHLGRFHLPAEPERFVLYLTRRTAPALDGFPNLARHLERFRPMLQLRRETKLGKCAWWHLHWPRDESIFVRPRVLSVQMGARPSFVYAAGPTFVGFSVNLILERDEEAVSLKALTGVLNSRLAGEWFERHAKRRGVHLEINAGVLRGFPLPARDLDLDQALGQLVDRRQRMTGDDAPIELLEAEIESLVERWYRLPAGRS